MPDAGPYRFNRYIVLLFLVNLVLVLCAFNYYNGTVMRKFDEIKILTVQFMKSNKRFAPGQRVPVQTQSKPKPENPVPLKPRIVEQAPSFSPTPIDKLRSMGVIELYNKYMDLITKTTAVCQRRVRYGNVGDGGWEVCQDAPYTVKAPCLVYSMGINWDFTFDDAISKQVGCKVHAFDPSMKTKSFSRSNLVEFHNYGLKGENVETNKQTVVQTSFQLKNFDEILTSLKHKEKTINYFKMDIEGPEWTSMDLMLQKNLMSHVRQFAWEVHIWGFDFKKEKFIYAIGILERLKAAGFEAYYSHQNPMGFYQNPHLNQRISCCYEIYYINTKYASGKDD